MVTAAAQGIGRAAAEAFASEGATVLALDIQDAPPAGAAGRHVRIDLLDPSAIAGFGRECGEVDILLNCAGIVHDGDILGATTDELDLAFALNVKSAFHMIRALLPGMVDRGRGSIINIASVAGSIIAVRDRAAYGTTKAALIGLTKSVALDFVTTGVRCNAICPGTVETPSLAERLAATGDAAAARAAFTARQPMGRIGMPKEVAELAVYLASDAASFTTGAVHVIDGGWSNA